jgi:hypothetical protein
VCFCWFYILTSDSFSRNGEQLVSNWLRSGTRIDMQSRFSEITNQRNGAVFFAVRIIEIAAPLILPKTYCCRGSV